jgi:hypothetical protein
MVVVFDISQRKYPPETTRQERFGLDPLAIRVTPETQWPFRRVS